MKLTRKNKLQTLSVLILFFIAGHSFAFDLLDKTIAVVEEKLILESDLKRRLLHVRFQNDGLSGEITDDIKNKALKQLIDEELQLLIAERAKVAVEDKEVDAAYSNFAKQLQRQGKSIDQYLSAVNVDTTQVKQQIKRDLTIQKVQQGSLNQRIRITDREIDQFLNSKEGQEWIKPRYRLGHILLSFKANGEANALATAQQLYIKLQNNEVNFKAAARQFSNGPNSSKGGDLGWKAQDEMPTLFSQQADLLKPNQVSTPFRSNAGIHMLKLYQRNGADAVLIERYKARHILIKTSELFTEEDAQKKINSLYQSLQQGADFIKLAKENTDDTASKFDGGDLGWSLPGKFVPTFEKMLLNTPPGEISKPFRSSFGWHILLVEDKRTDNMFETVKRNRAGMFLRNRRLEDELQIWLQELRENAYVDIIEAG